MASNDRLMRIGEVAVVSGMKPKTIRFYEEMGLLPPPSRNAAGYRMYTMRDVDRLRFIQKAKGVGLSLEEIRSITALRNRGEVPCAEVRTLIEQKLVDIRAQIAALVDLEKELTELQKESDQVPTCDECFCEIIEHHANRS